MIILTLFNALISLPKVFNFFFLFIIIYSPLGVTLAPYIFIISVVSASLLNTKAVRANIKNNLSLNLLIYFILVISLYFVGHA
jgi:hypothetical protein